MMRLAGEQAADDTVGVWWLWRGLQSLLTMTLGLSSSELLLGEDGPGVRLCCSFFSFALALGEQFCPCAFLGRLQR